MDTQVGNLLGVTAAGVAVGTGIIEDGTTLLTDITADGVGDNELVVATVDNLEVGMVVDILVRATGSATGGATARTIESINGPGLTVTYSGADVDPDNTFGLYLTGAYKANNSFQNRSNLNGGKAFNAGFDMDQADTVASMRAALQAFDSDTYSDDQLNKMTYNDLVFACRSVFRPASIRSEPLPTL